MVQIRVTIPQDGRLTTAFPHFSLEFIPIFYTTSCASTHMLAQDNRFTKILR